ncbi:MAG: right-handed parallel beta-helix repeat-containing protein [Steroidobacteraceae bacterium]
MSGSAPCLQIRDASDVVLHCDGHRVSDSPDRAIRAIAIRDAPRFTIADCEIVSDGVRIDDSPNGHIRDSRFRRLPGIANQPLALVRRASGMRFEYNDVADVAWSFLFSDDVIVADNRFHVTPGELAVIPYHVCFFYGRNDQVLRNEFSGGWSGTTMFAQLTNEVDDAVVLKDTVDARVEHNSIENYWDAGIEWVGNLDSGHIASNVIVNAGIAAIGGWYWSSVANTRFEKNVGVRVATLFRATRDFGLRPAGYDGPTLPADTAVRFRDNVFDANVLRGAVSLNIYGAAGTDAGVITVFSRMSYTGDLSALPGERVPTDAEFELTNNVFRHNDFGRLHSVPQFGFSPPVPGVIVDGGQNLCAEPPADYPLNCG